MNTDIIYRGIMRHHLQGVGVALLAILSYGHYWLPAVIHLFFRVNILRISL